MDAHARSRPTHEPRHSGIDDAGSLSFECFDLNDPLPHPVFSWLEQHAPDRVFLTPDWFAQLHAFQEQIAPSLPSSSRFWMMISHQGTMLVAAPMERFKGRLGFTELGLFTNYYSPLIELTIDSARITRADAWALLVRALDQVAPSWLALKVTPLRQAQQATLELGLGGRYATFAQEVSANHTVELPDLALYWKSRSSRLNTTLKRKGKSLAKADHRFELLQTPSATQIADYWEIYRHSWKIQEPTPRFINWLMAWGADNGHLRLGLLYVDGAVVACQLWLMNRRVGHIFKLAQNQAADQYSPGSLLTEFMINSLVAQDGMTKIDFLLGDDGFKPTWMDSREPIYWVEVVNSRRLLGKLLVAYYAVRERLRKLKKPVAEQTADAAEAVPAEAPAK